MHTVTALYYPVFCVKTLPSFYGIWRFITSFKTSRHLSLFWARTIQFMLPSHFIKIRLNIILPSKPGSSKWSLSLRFPHQNLLCNSSFSLCPFRNKAKFYGEMMLAPRPTLKLEVYPLSAFRDSLFNVFTATLGIWRQFLHPLPEDAPCAGDREPLVMGCSV